MLKFLRSLEKRASIFSHPQNSKNSLTKSFFDILIKRVTDHVFRWVGWILETERR